MRAVEEKLKSDLHFTPHSARAGFASDACAAGRSFVEIREAGRWVADSSLRTYVDIVTAAAISTSLRLEGLRPAILWARANVLEFFPEAQRFAEHGEETPSSTNRARQDGSSLAERLGPETGWLPQPSEAEPEISVSSGDNQERGGAGRGGQVAYHRRGGGRGHSRGRR